MLLQIGKPILCGIAYNYAGTKAVIIISVVSFACSLFLTLNLLPIQNFVKKLASQYCAAFPTHAHTRKETFKGGLP